MLLLSGSRPVQLLLNWSVDDCPGLSYFRQLGPTAPKWSPRGPSNEDETKDQLLGEIKRLSAARGMCNVKCTMFDSEMLIRFVCNLAQMAEVSG